jgi:cyclomaltodextrinase / maltogenic alpha-amylase / neopullulanase
LTRSMAALACLALTACVAPSPQATVSATSATPVSRCQANPLGQRTLYLRGSFNQWGSPDNHAFAWVCNEMTLVTALKGEHRFKLGDEAWSNDADWGGAFAQATIATLVAKADPFIYSFNGTYRFRMTPTNPPSLTMTPCNNPKPPMGDTRLYLRGSMNNWGALDAFAFEYSCDAYYLNIRTQGLQQFKIAAANWADAATFGASTGGRNVPAHDQAMEIISQSQAAKLSQTIADIQFQFDGEATIKLAFEQGEPRITVGPLSYASATTATVDDPIALSAKHDSRSLQFKQPFGAQPSGTPILFALSAKPGIEAITLMLEKRRLEGNQELLEYSAVASLPMTLVQSESASVWQANYQFDTAAVYGYWFDVKVAGKHYAYQNNSDVVYWTREKGSNGSGKVEPFPDTDERRRAIRRFRHTTYQTNFTVPQWADQAVYYYIFPERFRNGNPANDPKPGVTRYHKQGIEFHSNWLDKPYKPGTNDGSDAIYNNDFYGGDLQGIVDKLDYIADLGANVVYLTPIFKAASNHKYDTADYTQVDPSFGSNDDFQRLTKEAKARGIRVMVDASFNHVGADSVYFDRYGNFGNQGAFANDKINRQSPYADWFTFDANKPTPDTQYRGWVGVTDLPELNKDSKSYRDFVLYNADSITKRWLTQGASGWRMDVVPWVSDDFWREWRKVVKATDPNAMTVAETWWDSSKYFLGDTFDSTMNYIFRSTVLDYANGGDAAKLYANLELTRELYPPQVFHRLMNLLGSHDQARPLHIFGATDPANIQAINLAKARFKLAVQFQMWFPGSPAIYYGDEVGLLGGEDPYNRAAYPWADKGGQPDLDLLGEFKKQIALRQKNPILSQGRLHAPLLLDQNVIVLLRELNDQWAITATNNSDQEKTVSLRLPPNLNSTQWRELQGFGTIKANNNQLTLVIPPLGGLALLKTTLN